MNIAIIANRGNSYLRQVGEVLLVNVGDDFLLPPDVPDVFLDGFARTVIDEVARIRETSPASSRQFIDFSYFEEIVSTLRSGRSHLCDLDPAFLAQVFCHISMSDIAAD